jgi:hypothetical protein
LNDISISLNQYNPANPNTYVNEHIIRYNNYSIASTYTSGTTTLKDYKYNLNSDLLLIDDTVFRRDTYGALWKFDGKIRVVGSLEYVDEFQKKIYNANATLGLFTVKNGVFDGDQIYYSHGDYRNNINKLYFKCKIKPFMEVVYGRDYIEVAPNESYDFIFGGGVYSVKYYKILKPQNETFIITRFWDNGKLFDSHNYNYNSINFINASLNRLQYKKTFNLVNQSNVKMYHYMHIPLKLSQ